MARIKLREIKKPGYIGKLKLKNRLIHMGSQGNIPRKDIDENGVPQRLFDFYEALAAGGFSLVSVGGGIINFESDAVHCTSVLRTGWTPELLALLAERIHKHGAYACWQLMLNSMARRADKPGTPSLASSTLTQEDMDGLLPFYCPTTEMTHEQIDEVVRTFADVAAMLKDCGYDAIEINAGHVHGLNTFLSSAWNRRTDEYGGSPANRARIVCEIDRAIKERCGEDFPVINNLSGAEFMLDGGQTVADAVEIAKALEAAGCDALHCRYEMYHAAVPELELVRTAHEAPDIDLYPGYLEGDYSEFGINNSFGKGIAGWSGAAAAIKQAVNIPVSVAGRTDAWSGEQLIREGKVDFINICRRAIADHDYVNKALEGRFDDIRPCVGCFTCYDTSTRGVNSWCMVNGGVLEGKNYATVFPAEVKKRVLVIGSGAAGLESARVAALRGHDVILAEREPKLGGTLPLAGLINDFHEDFLAFSRWQVREVKKLGVDIRVKTEVDKAFVETIKPDVIIVAVGGAEDVPDIPGIGKSIVMTGEELHKQLKVATKYLDVQKIGMLSKLYLPLGKKVVLIGGAAQGLQTARFLMKRGREVVIVEEGPDFGAGMLDCGPKPNLLRWLFENKVEMYKSAHCKEITDQGLVIVTEEDEEKLIEADNVVTTLPFKNNLALYEQLKDLAPEVYAIGDCNPLIVTDPIPPMKLQPVYSKEEWPRFTVTAVREAWRIVREI